MNIQSLAWTGGQTFPPLILVSLMRLAILFTVKSVRGEDCMVQRVIDFDDLFGVKIMSAH